jgi:EmrB/QacA subfamily drug resistance transporter
VLVEIKEETLYQSSLSKRQKILAMAGTMLAMLIGSLYMTIVGTAMPRIVTDLGGFSQYTLVFTSFFIAEVLAVPITGKLSDMYGRKWFYLIGLIIFIISSFLSGISQTMMQLVIFRGLQGLGFGAMMALSFIVIGDIFPPEERGKYQGLMAAVMGVSSILGPTLGGYLTDYLSWRWCFFVNIPLGILVFFLFLFYYPQLQSNNVEKHKIDYAGVALMALGVIPLVLALNWGGADHSWLSPAILGMFGFSVVMFVLFCLTEIRAEEPIFSLGLFKNRVVTVSMIVTFLHGLSFFSIVTYLPLYFQGVMGTSATVSGTLMIPMMLTNVIGSIVCGQITSRTGGYYRLLSSIGFIMVAFGFFLFSRMTTETSYATAIMNIVLTGLGAGLLMPVHPLAVQNTVPYSIMGTAISMITWVRTIGGLFGLAIVGTILNNRFQAEFTGNLSSAVRAVVSPEELATIVDNPQALVNVDAQSQLRSLFDGLGAQGIALFEQLLSVLRNALNSALTEVFLAVFGVVIIALIVNLFLKGIPSYKRIKDGLAADPKDYPEGQ